MSNHLSELEAWFAERPVWMREAVNRLLHKGTLNGDDIKHFVRLAKCEVGIDEGYPSSNSVIPVRVSFQEVPLQNTLKLISISCLKGINALAPRRPLILDRGPLTVVYGLNASGKSGYIRVLKHASGQRKPGPLHTNVFSIGKEEQSCKFKCEIDGVAKELDWNLSQGALAELRGLQVYDSACASIYINEENEASYEPFELTLFTQLTEACGRVHSALEAEIISKPQRKPGMPPGLVGTQSGFWYGKLTHLITQADLEQKCTWSDDLEVELVGLNQRLIEANPSGKARDLRKQKERLLGLHRELAEFGVRLSDKGCIEYFEALRDSKAKKTAAERDAKIVFANAPLEGIGSKTWKLLWQQARAYSEEFAYIDTPFPNTKANARCVLCQQPLADDAKRRLVSFESFVRGGLETQAAIASDNLERLFQNFGRLPTAGTLNMQMDAVGLVSEPDRNAVAFYCRLLEERRMALLTTDQTSQLPSAPDHGALQFLKDKAAQIEMEALSLDQDALGQNRPTMELRREELVARKWLSQQQTSIQDEVQRLKVIHRLQEAQRLTNTQQLSTKKSSLADKLITGAFINRFQTELDSLGAGRIKVKLIKTRTERGHVFHEIRLQDPTKSVRTSDVLSEGEFRIVSLAAFLADVVLRGEGCPFIFDDPISSLDQVFEQRAARRLVELSKTRQVIVFTHRLSLLDHIDRAADEAGFNAPSIVSMRREVWGPGEPEEPRFSEMKPEGSLELLSQRLKRARETLERDGQSKYEDLATGICGDFRITIERVIEKILLCDIIRRHSREVHTKGKLKNLAKINDQDCHLFDEMMTKYSTHEHSQPEEAPVVLPEPNDIAEDIKKVQAWIVSFKSRP
jgi:hypothetical protein